MRQAHGAPAARPLRLDAAAPGGYDGCDVPSWLDPCDKVGALRELIASRFGRAVADKAFFANARAFFGRLEGV